MCGDIVRLNFDIPKEAFKGNASFLNKIIKVEFLPRGFELRMGNVTMLRVPPDFDTTLEAVRLNEGRGLFLFPMQYTLMAGFLRAAPPQATAVMRLPAPPQASAAGGSSASRVSDEVVASTAPRRESYPVTAVCDFVRFSQFLSNADNAEAALKVAAALLGCTGDHDVPTANTLRIWRSKLDCCIMLYERTLYTGSDAAASDRVARYLNYDSSPQGTYEYFIIVEDKITFHADPTRFESPLSNFSYERRTKPVMVLGAGRQSVQDKVAKSIHAAKLESGTAFNTWRKSVKGCVSDQGVERLLAQAPMAANPEESDAVQAAVEALRGGASLEEVADVVFLPESVQGPGMLHIIFDALETACTALGDWKVFETRLRAITKVLGNRRLSSKFMAVSGKELSPLERRMLEGFHGKHLTWRWESLEVVARQVLDRWLLFSATFNPDDFKSSHDDADTIKACIAAIASTTFAPSLHVVVLISSICGRFARWCKGCKCHEDILTSHSNWACRKRAMIEETGSAFCCWKGRRGPELVLFRTADFYKELMESSSSAYQESLLVADAETAAHMVAWEASLRSRLHQIIKGKLQCLNTLPLSLMGGFGEYVGRRHEETRSCIAAAVKEFEAITDDRLKHPVAKRLLGKTSQESLQLYEWLLRPEASLGEYPELLRQFQLLALVPIVELPAEGEHRKIQCSLTDARKPASVCATLRQGMLDKPLSTPDFVVWLARVWDEHNFWSKVLEPMMDDCLVKRMTLSEVHGAVYCYRGEDQYQVFASPW